MYHTVKLLSSLINSKNVTTKTANQSKPTETIWNHPKPPDTTWNHPNHPKLSATTHLKLSAATEPTHSQLTSYTNQSETVHIHVKTGRYYQSYRKTVKGVEWRHLESLLKQSSRNKIFIATKLVIYQNLTRFWPYSVIAMIIHSSWNSQNFIWMFANKVDRNLRASYPKFSK